MFTTEEKRVIAYSNGKHPTIPSSVTSETPIEELNLNWREKDLPEKERTKHVHRLHPYLGKFIPQLVEIFLKKYFRAGQTVLDPFCGSGTTIVQASELGINSVGYDISEFNILLSRTKTTKYDVERVRVEVMDILGKVRSRVGGKSGQRDFWSDSSNGHLFSDTENTYLNTWFGDQARRELLVYKHLIDSEEYEYKDLLRIILSRSARSSRLTTHYDLDFPKKPQTESYWCYKHSRTCHPTTDAMKFLSRYSLDTIKRIADFATKRTEAKIILEHADSRRSSFPPIDGVITSPPYVGLIDYHEQHAYGYHLLGLEDRRFDEIGPATNGSGAKAREQYQIDIAEVFRRAACAMSSKGRMIVVAADKANLYERIAQLAGLEVENVIYRHVNRRTGRRSTQFYESVFIWRKP